MNYTQNHKISQITPLTLIVGIDIAKDKHVARAQDDRGIEFGKRLIFENRKHGFQKLVTWAESLRKENGKNHVILGVEPTGHYWFSLAYFLVEKGYDFVMVNPMHVKKSKELDDNSPTKNDTKDARVIGQLIKDGRYSVPNLLDGVYAELREGVKLRDQLTKQLMTTEGRIQNHIQRYFPEFFDVFRDWEGKAAFCTLRMFPFPSQIKEMSAEEVLKKWKPFVQRGVGIKRARKLVEAAKKSIGIQIGIQFAQRELDYLLDQYELYKQQLAQLDKELEALVETLPGAKQMMEIPGLGSTTIALFFSEVGDMTKYSHPQQLVNLAGLSLREHSSGKFKGQTRITKRGRSRLRRALYLAIRPLVAHNPTFKALHQYYTMRSEKPLKKQQSLIALCCKLLRVLFVIGQKQCQFDGSKLLRGLPRTQELQVV
ncbi:IS110 family transposase [Bacillus sp. WMMC1349]|uniref:IS110 family transposase n=1 Tax=Bacillus sp. WMMC1349 TaxID=2736254 RepID=UPI001556CAF4|nr:IS110 family transposase [Bacillus sp. WMMC1349]NPC90741.1 IS110 family transposase [Bacillus sp. WMMC1349]NPC90791.1 IS110 family transposase [Bacillus sp. WMMC1349]NPC90979.1 IS110 family transposase [Bacillus sp. WMMC1349]NPC91077.1 IS110 family transposase [Bacillus sp. WMMC1349]NPC91265.1 IS110 family transposase [Bacillus sp. WMMC1349]